MKSFIIFLFVVLFTASALGQLNNRLDKLDVNDLTAKKLNVVSTTSGSKPCPSMTQVQRDAIVSPIEGQCIYNSTAKTLNLYDGSAWVEVAGGGEGGIAKWEASKFYEVDDVVISGNEIYICTEEHTSGMSFDPSKFQILAQDLANSTGVLSMSKGGTDKALTPELGGVVYTDAGSMEVLSAGDSGKFLQSNGAAAPSWESVAIGDGSFTGLLSLGKGGTNKNLSAENGAILYLDTDSVEKLSPGNSGQILQSNGAGAPTFVNKSISGKGQSTSAITLEEIQVPNSQLTLTDTGKYLVESGNKNILSNPSFENLTVSLGWTNSNGVVLAEATARVDGLRSAKVTLTSQILSFFQDSSAYQSQFADGVQLLASVRVKTSVVGVQVCPRQAASTIENLCIDVQANNKWGLYKVPFISGGTSNGIIVRTTSAVSGDVVIDDAFVGAVDLEASVDQSRIAGESYFPAATSCAPATTSTSVAAFNNDPDCLGPVIVRQNLGQWQTTDSNNLIQIVNNLPAGEYIAEFEVASYSNITTNSAMSITDGTTTCAATPANSSSTSVGAKTISCGFRYTNSGNRTFQLMGAILTGTLTISLDDTTNNRGNARFKLYYFGSGSVYTSTNADTDWAACTPNSYNGIGSPTNVEIQCKRQGSDLLMKGKLTLGTTTAAEMRVGFPLWNGSTITSKGTSVIPSIQKAGDAEFNGTFAGQVNVLIEPSVSYITFDSQGATFSGLTKRNGNDLGSSGTLMSFLARIPIEGWQNSNIIIGQFNGLEKCTDTLECTDTFSAKVSATGVVTDENIDWINGSCTYAGSQWSCGFKTSLFTVAPNCTVGRILGGTSGYADIETLTSSTIVVNTRNSSGAPVQLPFSIICQKQGADYIGKTAKAVASDQNVRSDVLKAVFYSAKISPTCVVSDELGDFINGNGTLSGTSICTFNFVSNKFAQPPTCNISLNQGSLLVPFFNTPATVSTVATRIMNPSATEVAAALTLSCHGVSP